MSENQISTSIIDEINKSGEIHTFQIYAVLEIESAKISGRQFTFLRPFICAEERMGIMTCCNKNCNGYTEFIQYACTVHARSAYCPECAKKIMELEIQDFLNGEKS